MSQIVTCMQQKNMKNETQKELILEVHWEKNCFMCRALDRMPSRASFGGDAPPYPVPQLFLIYTIRECRHDVWGCFCTQLPSMASRNSNSNKFTLFGGTVFLIFIPICPPSVVKEWSIMTQRRWPHLLSSEWLDGVPTLLVLSCLSSGAVFLPPQ